MATRIFNIVCVLLAGSFVFAQAERAGAQQPSDKQIIDALKPKGLTRGLGSSTPPPPNPREQRLIENLKNKPTRSITVEERTEVAAIAKTKPAIDLEIYFEYNSAQITPQALPTLQALASALSDAQFGSSTFMVGGHTDAKGSAEYNKDLSERRAEAVKRFLVEQAKVAPDRLMPIGFGKEQLKIPANPYADQNRRVQVVNMTAR
ncbi:MAG: OmpA family protein [Rhizobiales bacterium]|nr:OmpA family protein [Hyphomicrobiales bacterium]